jgi:hypothetical protein
MGVRQRDDVELCQVMGLGESEVARLVDHVVVVCHIVRFKVDEEVEWEEGPR